MNKRIHIKWESNSRVKRLLAEGKIEGSDIIEHTTTDKFPTEAATVRLHRVNQKVPFVTVHIRGKSKTRKAGWGTWDYAATCRVNMGGEHNDMMNSNGDLDENYTWLDVHNVVTEVKEAMGLNNAN